MGLREVSLHGSFRVWLGLVFGSRERKPRAAGGVGLEIGCQQECLAARGFWSR